jgi:hypothetical protein
MLKHQVSIPIRYWEKSVFQQKLYSFFHTGKVIPHIVGFYYIVQQ